MDKREAKRIAEKDLEYYRAMSYEDIAAKLGEAESFSRFDLSGEAYQIEFEFDYDNGLDGNIRVSSAVSYKWWTDFVPVCSDFIIAPDGRFIGE